MEPDHWPESYKIIERGGTGEIEEKKSRFIAHVAPACTEEEALAFIEARKKEYWDARHNCYAYILGEKGQTMRFSDDGEPTGTAGKPMLEVLSGSGVRNVVLVVTRYFGGIKLGTGGLVRAYTSSARLGIDAASLCGVARMAVMDIKMEYSFLKKMQNLSEQGLFKIENTVYEDMVTLSICCEKDKREDTRLLIANMTSGNFQVVFEGEKLVKVEI